MLNYASIVGNQDAWANYVTNVQAADTPLLDWLPVGPKPVNTIHNYQAEQYDDPAENSHVDGTPVTGAKNPGDGRGALKAVVHYATKAVAIKRLNQDLSNVAGIADELAHDILKRTDELKRDIEVALLEDDDHREDNEVVGYKTRGIGSWISTSAQALYPVPEAFRPPAASVDATATGSLTESIIINILESIGNATKSKQPITAFPGPKMKRAFNNIPFFTTGSALVGGSPTGATGVVYSKNGKVIDRTFQRYESDFGPVDVPGISWWNVGLGGSATEKAYCTYFLHQPMWELCWGPGIDGARGGGKPMWMRKPYLGGAYEAFCETVFMLVCKNPRGEGKYHPTS